ncbi:GDSL-type esterase/lipase family protein [Luteolibacter flavescens]|uniref:GDSL-type esterase/lipase family protein n=1 Tax=Luteolibacter flavescens TaxID=1859460 RepID=A0ABT3FJW3_9BACT|nr:GDSL-type esterase/lipase family protein [Luteolibacter flavescens]MCW1883856.1 GDSL-type esterase/lipase family protein [Luteolibacter flavescens]
MKRLLHLLLFLPLIAFATPDPNPDRFAKEIAAFDAADEKAPFEKGGIVFTGSSSIRLMDLGKVFPGLKALNRGFGGAHISEVNHYLDRCVLRYEPSLVVFYCGGNDLWDKKSPEQVEEDFTEFRRRLFEKVPEAKLIIMGVRPSPSRVSIRDKEADMNARFKKTAEADKRITYVAGSWDRFLDKDGKTIPELFVEDGLHMSDAGYAVWRELLLPLLPKH